MDSRVMEAALPRAAGTAASEPRKAELPADLKGAPVQILARAESCAGRPERAGSCPELLEGAHAVARKLQQLQYSGVALLSAEAAKPSAAALSKSVSIPGAAPASPERVCKGVDEEGFLPSSPSSEGSTSRYLKPLTPAQSCECYQKMPSGGASQSPSLSDTDMKEFPKPEACVAWVGSCATAPAALLSAVAAAVQEEAAAAGEEPAQQPHAQQPPSCELCNVVASSEGQLAAHVEGKRHRKHVAMAEVLGVAKAGAAEAAAGEDGDDEALRCDLCNVTAPSLTHKQLHLIGQKHQRREKQAAHLDAAQELSRDAVSAVIDDEEDTAPAEAAPAALAPAEQAVAGHPAPAAAADGAEEQAAVAAEAPVTEAPEQQQEDALLQEEEVVETETKEAAEEQGAEPAAGPEPEDAPGQAEGDDALDAGSEEGTGPMVTVQRAKPASVSADEEVEFQGCGVPSAFAAFGGNSGGDSDDAIDEDEPADCLSELPTRPSHLKMMRTVRFSQSFEREDSMDWDSGGGGLRRAGSARPPLAPSGGSVSLAAQHFCPVCGIIATSQANLEDHMRGRRHARRLQYIRNMPESERTAHMERVASGDWHLLARKDSGSSTGSHGGDGVSGHTLLRIGSITLPSSMDLRQYLEQMQEVGEEEVPGSPRAKLGARRTSLHRLSSASESIEEGDEEEAARKEAVEPPLSNGSPEEGAASNSAAGDAEELHSEAGSGLSSADSALEGVLGADEGNDEGGSGPRERHQCVVCGITTTSAAHLEAHLRGRKHKRRVDVSGPRPARPSSHYCKICDISTTSAQHMAMHVAGKAHCRRLATGHLPAAAAQKAAAEDESGASDVASSMARQPSGSNPGSPATNGDAAAAIAAAAAAVERAVNGTGERGGRSQQLQPIRLADVQQAAAQARGRQTPLGLKQQQQQHAAMQGAWGQAAAAQHQQRMAMQQQQQQQMHAPVQPASPAPYGYVGYYGPAQQQQYCAPQQQAYLAPAGWGQWVPRSAGYPTAQGPEQSHPMMVGYAHHPHMQLPSGYIAAAPMPVQAMSPRVYAHGGYGQPLPHGHGMSGYAVAGPQDYNCEACGTVANDLESYKQHIRAKTHVRRMHSNGRQGGRA